MNRLIRAKERLDNYYKAESAILSGQAYTIGSRSLTRADLRTVQNEIKNLEAEVRFLESGGKRKFKRVIPMDF